MECVQSILGFLFSRFREAASREFAYLTALEDNMQSLEDEMEELQDARDDLATKVEVAEGRSLARTHQVDRWLQRVGALEAEVAAFEVASRGSATAVESCSPGCWWSSYQLGRRVAKLLAGARQLKGEGSFDTVAEKPPPERVVKMPSAGAVGMDPMMVALRGFLRDDGAGAIGVHGPGGSGKTTLLHKLNNELLSTPEWDFNPVVFVVASKGDDAVDKIQRAIGERLDLPWQEEESPQSRAARVFRALEGKRFVLLLDDLWKPVDLELVGVPLPSRRNRCKVVVATRSEGVCSEMGAHHTVQMNCLETGAAWDLFVQNAGVEATNSHPHVPQLAMAIAAECGGLPLALIVVGRALAGKRTVQEWRHALTTLETWPSEIPGVAEKLLSRLRFSYDNLPTDASRSCFLYCSLFPQGYSISKEALVDYWICEGFLDEYADADEARDKAYDLIGGLQSVCLLESGDDPESQVRMHDVIRDLALWIASEEGKKKNKFLVLAAGAGLKEMPDSGRWTEAERISLMRAKAYKPITEAPTCPSLLTLMLQGNWGIHTVPDGFFNSMPFLRVLDLSSTRISMLPVGIGLLGELQYLNLSGTSINSLPDELGHLKKLRHLDLRHTNHLGSIPSKVMLGLCNLQVLNVFKSSYGNWKLPGSGDEEGEVSFEDLESMKHLRKIGVSIHTGSSYSRYLKSDVLPELTECLYLKNCDDLATINVISFGNMKSLKKLYVDDLGQLEELLIGAEIESKNGPLSGLEVLVLNGLERSQIRSEVFSPQIGFWSLRSLEISFCHRLENITWVLKLQCLEEISLSFCDRMDKVIDLADEEDVSISFPRLKKLKLNSLKNLKAVSGHVLPFPSLESLYVTGCQELNKLPLGPQSGKNFREIRGEGGWWNGLEWENWDIRSTFLPYFRQLTMNKNTLPSEN